MSRRSIPLALAAIGLLAAAGAARAQAPSRDLAADRAAVHQAVLDYVDGFYQGDSTRLVRSVRPEFFKTGWFWSREGGKYENERMSWQAAMDFVRGVKEKKRFAPPTAPKEIVVLDVADQTAAAKLTAWWGIDYLLLARYGDKWMISHILWQSTPPKPKG